jgi:tripeptidyl-peptidase-1
VHFDRRLVGRDATTAHPGATRIGQPGAGGVGPVSVGKIKTILDGLESCSTQITPTCLQALYGYIYPKQFAAHKNSYAVVEYSPQAYLQTDLDRFYKNFSTDLVGTEPKFVSIDGGVNQDVAFGFGFNGEPDLDIQYAQALIGKDLQLTLYQVGDLYEGASFNNLLDALDKSYWLVPSLHIRGFGVADYLY